MNRHTTKPGLLVVPPSLYKYAYATDVKEELILVEVEVKSEVYESNC